MPNKTQLILFFFVTVLVVVSIGYYNVREDVVPEKIEDIKMTENYTDNTEIPLDDVSVDVTTNDNSDKTPITGNEIVFSTTPIPDLDRPIVFPGEYSSEKAKEITGYITILTDALKADSDRFNEWIDLGILRKSIEDYEGARQAWGYAGAIRPANSLSFLNLGMLYGYYLNEPIKAEANLLHAIENEPRFLDFYTRMTDFYIEVMNDKNKAVDFLDRTIEKYPEWTDIERLREHITK